VCVVFEDRGSGAQHTHLSLAVAVTRLLNSLCLSFSSLKQTSYPERGIVRIWVINTDSNDRTGW
jgi:hypothetical protein